MPSHKSLITSCRSPLTASNSFRIILICKNASVNPYGSHTSKKPRIYVKTMRLKSFGLTYIRGTSSQAFLNHILTQNEDRGGGRGAMRSLRVPIPSGRGATRRARVPTPVGKGGGFIRPPTSDLQPLATPYWRLRLRPNSATLSIRRPRRGSPAMLDSPTAKVAHK